jgi:apolipoprotein N-acyltransferase
LRPAHAVDARRWLERLGLALLYLGLPAWLLLRTLSA